MADHNNINVPDDSLNYRNRFTIPPLHLLNTQQQQPGPLLFRAGQYFHAEPSNTTSLYLSPSSSSTSTRDPSNSTLYFPPSSSSSSTRDPSNTTLYFPSSSRALRLRCNVSNRRLRKNLLRLS